MSDANTQIRRDERRHELLNELELNLLAGFSLSENLMQVLINDICSIGNGYDFERIKKEELIYYYSHTDIIDIIKLGRGYD